MATPPYPVRPDLDPGIRSNPFSGVGSRGQNISENKNIIMKLNQLGRNKKIVVFPYHHQK